MHYFSKDKTLQEKLIFTRRSRDIYGGLVSQLKIELAFSGSSDCQWPSNAILYVLSLLHFKS